MAVEMRRTAAVRCGLAVIFFLVAVGAAGGSVRLEFPQREAATVGILITDLRSGSVVASENPRTALIPASVQKTVTAAVALTALGPDFRFATDFVLEADSLAGEDSLPAAITVRPSGDPTFGSRHFPADEGLGRALDTICQLAPLRIAGGVNPGGVGEKWEVEDLQWAYGAGCYAFNFADNSFRGVDPETGRAELYSDDAPWETFAEQYGCQKASVAAPAESETLYRHFSPLAIEIISSLLERSDNLFAEGMLRAIVPSRDLGEALTRQGEILDSLGIDRSAFRPYDGSGLTRANLLTPQFLTDVLTRMAAGPRGTEYVATFPRCGRTGTVKNFLAGTALAGRLALKSGSMGGVHSYAGYLLDAKGNPTHTVVIIVNNFFCRRQELRKAMADYLLKTLR